MENIKYINVDDKGKPLPMTTKARVASEAIQSGKPLHGFWLNPSQDAAADAVVDLVMRMSESDIQASKDQIKLTLRNLGICNASNLGTFLRNNFERPEIAGVQVDGETIAKIGL